MKKPINVLQLFGYYLPDSEVWAYQLLNAIPGVKNLIASKNFLACNYYSNSFEYLRFPIKPFQNPRNLFFTKLINKFISLLLMLYPLYLLTRCKHCDIMHSHFAPVGWQYMNLAKWLKIPHVVSFYGHDYEWVPKYKPVWIKRYRALFKHADLFLCEGNNGVRLLKKAGCPSEKIIKARLGVDTSLYSFYQREKKVGELHLIQIARFVEKKGHQYAFEAFIAALNNCSNMTLTFVGNDRIGIRKKIMDDVLKKNLMHKIRFIDHIDYTKINSFLKAYHVFIHPSCYSRDKDCEGGAPIVLLDAQATGMPVISTYHCDIPDEVIHGKTGLLSDEKDIGKLAESIQTFYYMDQFDYNRFAASAAAHVKKNYDIKKNSEIIRNRYDKLINSYRYYS